MNNRYPVTVRFNLREQANLRSLQKFWSMNERDVLKLAFEQLVTATNQLQKKLPVEGSDENQTDTSAGNPSGAVLDRTTEPVTSDAEAGGSEATAGDAAAS